MAEASQEKFALVVSEGPFSEFPIEESSLGFRSVSPDGFLWNESDVVPPEFIPANVFSSMQREYIGYDPLNRDRLEISLFSAKIIPERVANAVDYARLLAIVWGNTNFGVQTHSPIFGEVLAGDNSSGIMVVSRITVFRRGDELLIIRSRFQADYFERYAEAMATFLGSLQFRSELETDVITASLQTIPPMPQSNGFGYAVPQNWEELPLADTDDHIGSLQLWVDAADPNRNSAMIVTALPPMRAGTPNLDASLMANLAATQVQIMASALLPDDTEITIAPPLMNELGEFKDITAFNGLFSFEVSVNDTKVRASAFVTIGKDGTALISAILTTPPSDLYLTGTRNHANFALGQTIEAMRQHWTAMSQQ